jgi:hypothetical protein
MAIQSFKDIIDSKGYRINSKDREIFETSDLQSFFGLSDNDAIEFIVYDANDNQLPQADFGMVRYVPLTTQNIKDYFLIADGTIFQAYSFPNEYFIDVERLLAEAGYVNGIFKTQITLINKRAGSDKQFDKLWISEISPSRTEIRLMPLNRPENVGTDLFERYGIFVKDGHFREDTIEYAIQFIEKINPTQISSFIKNKYGSNWFDKMNAEFKIQGFEVFSTNVYNKFMQSALYEFTNRNSNIRDLNYGKPNLNKPSIELTKDIIKTTIIRLLIKAIDFYLSIPDVKVNATYDIETDTSMDIVGQVLQRKQSDTLIDTSNPVITKAERIKVVQTDAQLELQKQIEKELPPATPPPPADTPTTTTKVSHMYSYRGYSGGTIYWTDSSGTQRSMYTNPNQEYQIGCAQEGTLSGFGPFTIVSECGDVPTQIQPAVITGGGSGGGAGFVGISNNDFLFGQGVIDKFNKDNKFE